MHDVSAILGSPYGHTTGNEERYNCPYCHKRGRGEDTKYHLYFNRSKGLFFCQRCEARGHISFLTGGSSDKSYGEDDEGNKLSRMDSLRSWFAPKAPERKEKPVEAGLPDGYIPLLDYPKSQAAKYLESRGIPYDVAIQRGIGFGVGKLRGRVVFPVFDPNDKTRCLYWVARSYTNLDHDADCECWLCKYKYTNAPGVKRRYFIYGLEFCDEDNDTVCITEGAVSALNSGDNAVGTFGKYVTDEQLDILSDRFKRIQVALDPDAYKRAYYLMKRILGRGLFVEWISLPSKKDPADIGIEHMTYLRTEEALPITRASLSQVLLSGVGELR